MNSDIMRELRMSILNGESAPTCKSCKNEDQYGKVSGRQRQLLKSVININDFDKTFCASPHWDWFEYSYTHDGETKQLPVDLQIDLGNTCNSGCIMCIPTYSSRLATDYPKLNKLEPDLFKLSTLHSNWADDPALVDKFVDELASIPNIRYLHFLGGETLYLRSFYTICQRLIDMGLAKDISIGTTTNCTIYTPELESTLRSFKHAHLGLSVESLHTINDYVRWPSTVDVVEENIKQFLKLRDSMDLQLSLRITPSVFSIFHIDTLFRFMLDNSVIAESCNVLVHPSCLRIELLPKDLIDIVIKKVDAVINEYELSSIEDSLVNRRNETIRPQVINKTILEYRDTLEHLKTPSNLEEERYDLVKFIKAFETLRKNNILDYLPEYEEFLRRYGY